MTLNNHFAYTFEERPTPKLWLCKPDGTRIERIADFSKLGGTFKFTNVNTLHFDLPLQVFSEDTKQIERNKVVDLVKNKYLIDYRYNGYRDIFVIDDIKKSANDSDFITLNLDSRASELNKKAANEIELLGSTIPQMMNKILSVYAPLWKLGHVDGKIIDVKRELTGSNTTVNALIDNICSLFDAVAIYNNINRTISFYHKDNVGTNRGLRVRENSYLKSFEDQFVSKDIVTRLYPFGQSGLTIQSVNPAGSSYIEDFSYFMSPFKRDNNRNVLQHSDYMSDELCHALLDYQEFYASKKDQAGELSKQYSALLKEHSQEVFRLNQLSATLQRLNERVELIKPKSEYIDLGTKIKNFKITVPKSSYYLIMIRNDGSFARIKFNNKQYDIPSGEWLYIKLKTGKFNDATKFEKQLEYPLEILSANANLRVVYTRSSEGDYEEEDTKTIEEKYNLEKYKILVKDQEKVVASIERRLKAFEDQKASVIRSMNAKNFLSEKLYNERELYVFESVWTEENHTDAQELYDDAVKQMKEQKKINRTITVDLVNFIQSLDHKDDWDKLNVGDKVVFQNKIFNTKIKAYITEMQLDFQTNQVKITISDIFDYKDLDTIIAEKLAQTTSTSSQVDFHKQQIREQTGRITDMTRLIEGEWDANKKRVMAGNETVDIGSHGVKVISKENPNEFVIMVGGVIAMTRDNGETFKTGITPEGINAEMLIGKMIVGETLTFENESGTVKFDKDGLYVNSKNFHLVSNDGEENYFDKLKREMSENAKQQTDRMLEEYKKEVSQTISEATDVRNIVDNAADILQAAFADGVITDVEKRLISETLAQLEKENREFEDKINLALNHPYITEEDTIELNNSIVEYSSMYETLVISINESVSDKMITPQESEEINQNIINFREEIKDILSLVEEIIERTKNAQLQATLEEAKDYTTRVRDDIKDELNDLNNSFKSLNSTVEESLQDNIFDAAELEAIKTVVLVTKSEYQDITNRYSSMSANTDLKSESKLDLTKAYKTLDTSFNDFVKYIDEMTMDRIADETEKANYKKKYDTLQKNLSDYMKKYDNCILEISKKYSNDAADKVLGDFTAIATELQNDFQDVKDNWAEFKQTTLESFQDGIVTEAEKARLRVQLDMLDRESMDIEERYKSLLANQYTNTDIKNRLAASRSPYLSAHASLRKVIEQIIADGKVDESEKTLANNSLNKYNTTLTTYSKAIQEALNTLSQIISSDVASKKVEEFNGVITTISSDVDTIKKQRDGAVITYYYSGVPTLSNDPAKSWTTNDLKDLHIKDMYLDTKSGYAYTFTKSGTSYSWKPLTDQVIVSSLKQAKNAQDTADNKRRVFVTQPTPPYDQGDMWTQGSQGDIYVCQTPKAKGGIYSISDWVKASKYTDDTVANSAVQQLNEYKRTNNLDIAGLKRKTSDFEKTVVNAFDDRVISISESSAIKGQLTLLNHEKDRLTRQYENIIGNSNLVGAEKTKLSTAYSNMNTKLSDLSTTINSAIVDNKIVDAESKSVTSKFELYKASVNEYQLAFDNALNSIIREMASSQAKDRLDEWKRTEFSTDSDGIIERVAGAKFDSKWTDTWRDTVNPAISKVQSSLNDTNNKISSLKTGGVNLLQSYREETKAVVDPNITSTKKAVFDRMWALPIYKPDYFRNYLQPDTEYTISYEIQIDNFNGAEKLTARTFGILLYDYTDKKVLSSFTLDFLPVTPDKTFIGKKFKVTKTFTTPSSFENNLNFLAYASYGETKDGKRVYPSATISNLKLETGNIASDWTPAPEDTSTTLQEYNTRISSAETFIEKNKDKISQIATKADVDASLSKVATYEAQYSVSSGNSYQVPLQEYNGSFFTDNYTYEVVAKNNSLSSNNVATAIFVSKGSNNGYELVELDNISKTGANPKFVLDSKGRPSISTFSPQSTTQDISVIYTKYLGSASAINTTKSLIEQTASSIELQVKKLTAETEYNNILLNSDFSSGWEGWINVDPQYSIVDKNTFGITLPDAITNKNKKYNTVKMTYNKNTNYPSVFSNFISVGKGQEVAIGEHLTLTCYAYIPSSSKGKLTGNIYIEFAGYYEKDQKSNPMIARHEILPKDFEYNKWFRMTASTAIPSTNSEGKKINYIRACLRYDGKNQSVNNSAIFYYALPQLERGSKPTEWSLSRLDVFSTEQLAAKIALNPESVDIIARNIDFNTDSMKIYNSNGTLNISGDTLTISNNNSSNEVIINPKGFTLKKDGVVKFKNGLDTSDYSVQAYEPQFSSWNNIKATDPAAKSKYNYIRHIEPGMNGYYTINTGVYNFAVQHKQLLEVNNTKNARVNRYTYLYNKRYLKIQMSASSQGKSKLYIIFKTKTGDTTLHQEIVSSSSMVYPDITIDLQAKLGYPPNNLPDFFELQAGIAYGENNSIDGFFRIRRMAMTDTPNAEV